MENSLNYIDETNKKENKPRNICISINKPDVDKALTAEHKSVENLMQMV